MMGGRVQTPLYIGPPASGFDEYLYGVLLNADV